ncbi:MAG: hypothetical protein M1485_02885 [Chloroflexi bacterium]|nr:hypothetical protein [Chloroflexota bacterium]
MPGSEKSEKQYLEDGRGNYSPVARLSQVSTVFIMTNGCPEARIDAAALDVLFKEKYGIHLVHDWKTADLIIFFGCAVTQDKEDLSLSIIDLFEANEKPNARLLVIGCITKVSLTDSRMTINFPTCSLILKSCLPLTFKHATRIRLTNNSGKYRMTFLAREQGWISSVIIASEHHKILFRD